MDAPTHTKPVPNESRMVRSGSTRSISSLSEMDQYHESLGRRCDKHDIDAITPDIRQQLLQWAERAKATVARQKYERARSLLMPDSLTRAVWDAVNLCLLTWTTFEIPVSMLFTTHDSTETGLKCTWNTFMIVNFIVDTLFLVDVGISFNTAYYDQHAILVDDRRDIAVHYMTTWFLLDVSTSIPLDQIICTLGLGANIDGQILRSVKIIRLLKLARVLKFMRILKKWELVSGSKSVRTASRMCKFVSLMIFVTHMAGCMWMIPVVHGNCAPESELYLAGACTNWLNNYAPELMQGSAPWSSKYLASLYFAVVTLSTVGYGDVLPSNDLERCVAALLALAGAVIFAYCIGSISTLANQESLTEVEIDVALRSLHDFLQYNSATTDTQTHVKQHLLFTSKTAPHLIHRCLDLLPRRLRYKIIEDSFREHLHQCPIFVGMDLECRAFLAQFLKPLFLPQNEFLFQALEIGMEMFFITKGEVEVLNLAGVRVLTRLRKGDFVGEIALFPELISYRTSSVRAAVDTDLFELSRSDLEQNIKPHFPDIYEAIREIATVRFRWLDVDPIVQAMTARCMMRCRQLHTESVSYEEQRLAILRKEIQEGMVTPDETTNKKLQMMMSPTANMHAVMKLGSNPSSAPNSRAGSRRSNLSVAGSNNAATASKKKPDVCLVPTSIIPLQKAGDAGQAHVNGGARGRPPASPRSERQPSIYEPCITVTYATDYQAGGSQRSAPPESEFSERKMPPPMQHLSPTSATDGDYNGHPASQLPQSPGVNSPRRWDDAYPRISGQAAGTNSATSPRAVSPHTRGETQRSRREGMADLGMETLSALRRLSTQVQGMSPEISGLSSAMSGLSKTVHALHASHQQMMEDMSELRQEVRRESDAVHDVKEVVEREVLSAVKIPSIQHATTLKSFGYKSALKN